MSLAKFLQRLYPELRPPPIRKAPKYDPTSRDDRIMRINDLIRLKAAQSRLTKLCHVLTGVSLLCCMTIQGLYGLLVGIRKCFLYKTGSTPHSSSTSTAPTLAPRRSSIELGLDSAEAQMQMLQASRNVEAEEEAEKAERAERLTNLGIAKLLLEKTSKLTESGWLERREQLRRFRSTSKQMACIAWLSFVASLIAGSILINRAVGTTLVSESSRFWVSCPDDASGTSDEVASCCTDVSLHQLDPGEVVNFAKLEDVRFCDREVFHEAAGGDDRLLLWSTARICGTG